MKLAQFISRLFVATKLISTVLSCKLILFQKARKGNFDFFFQIIMEQDPLIICKFLVKNSWIQYFAPSSFFSLQQKRGCKNCYSECKIQKALRHFHTELTLLLHVQRTSGHHRILWDPNKSDWAFHPESPLHILVSAFELNYTLVFPLDNSYGTQTNGIFSGILGLLQNQVFILGVIFQKVQR